MSSETRYRLVVLGSSKVGKTSLIRRYFYKEFPDKYKETVEDLHSRDFRIKGVTLALDVLDTNFNFPDMRRLAIAAASAFMLVFAVDDVNSFKMMSELWSEIKQLRSDIDELPTVIVGNKADLTEKKIYAETAQAFIGRLNANRELRYVEVSARTGSNVYMIFRNLLELSGFPAQQRGGGDPEAEGAELDVDVLATPAALRRHRSMRAGTGQRQEDRSPRTTASEHVPLSARSSSPNMLLRVAGAATSPLSRNRSLRVRSTTRKEEAKAGGEPQRDGDQSPRGGQSPRERLVTPHVSLLQRTRHLSLRMKKVGDAGGKKTNAAADVDRDESDCKIS